MVDTKRIATIIQTLKDAYPKAGIILRYSTPWELLVAVILSAQCTDSTVNNVTQKLFAKYKTLDAYVHADPTGFEGDIKSTGFYHNKAKHVLAAAKIIQTRYNGTVPHTMRDMVTIPGVARKTANVVLGNAYGVVAGIAVDTHVLRVSQRLRFVDVTKIGGKKLMIDFKKDADPVKIEKELMAVIPKKDWFPLTYLLIDHGRAVCRAQNPNCAGCVVSRLCPSSRLQA
jgi:endonuclease-3